MMRFVTNNYNVGEVHGGVNKVSLPMQNIPLCDDRIKCIK